MPLTSRPWFQITASSAKFTWLAKHRKIQILGNNGDMSLIWMGRFISGFLPEYDIEAEDSRELTKRRRRRQRRRYKTLGLVSKNNGSARSARAFYILVHFFAVIP